MNTKTTLYLALLLSLLVAGFLFLTRGGPQSDAPPDRRPATPDAAVEREVLAQPLGDPVKIVVNHGGDEQPWVFETHAKDADGYPRWEMTSPVHMEAVRWEVERIPNTIKNAKYVLAFAPGAPGAPTEGAAGLTPPRWTITITDTQGKSDTLEIGKPRSAAETYVRRAGQKEILVATTSFNELVRSEPVTYRAVEFWSFKPEDARRVEIIDRTGEEPVTYVIVPDGRTGWRFEQPFAAPATEKVRTMVQTFGNMRVLRWLSDDASRVRGYGFEPAAYTLRATVEQQEPITDQGEPAQKDGHGGDASSDAAEPANDTTDAVKPESAETPKTRTVSRTYEFEVSTQSPLGEESKVLVRLGGTNAIGDIMKVAADKLKPSPTEWRDLRLVTAPLANPLRVELTASGQSAVFSRRDGRWFFEDGRRAEDTLVTEIVTTIANLRAVVFEESPEATPSHGFDQPLADIRISASGRSTPDRFMLGAYSDPQSKRLLFARFGNGPVAKLRVEDVRSLLREPREYLDRTVFQIAPNRIERLAIARANQVTGDPETLEFERPETQWLLKSPISAPARQDRIRELVDQLGALRAQTVLGELGKAADFGLDDPEITVTLTYKPPVEFRMEPRSKATPAEGEAHQENTKEGEAAGGDTELVSVEHQPPSQDYKLRVALHAGKAVALREDGGHVVEIPLAIYEQLSGEFRSGELFRGAAEDVTAFVVQGTGGSNGFERREGKWVYSTEPDLPLDQAKVQNLLLQIRSLKTERFIRHTQLADASDFADSLLWQVEVARSSGAAEVLRVSSRPQSLDGDVAYAAVMVGQPGEFLLTPGDLARLDVRLTDIEAR